MKNIVKLLLIIVLITNYCFAWFFDMEVSLDDSSSHAPYCREKDECSINKWYEMAPKWIIGIEKTRSWSQYIQSIIVYLLGFTSIIWVLYIIYSWLNIFWAFDAGDGEKVKKSKSIILSVLMWITIMWLAYSIVVFIEKIVNV